MPTYCDPWPGNTKARLFPTTPPLFRRRLGLGFLAEVHDLGFEVLPKLPIKSLFFRPDAKAFTQRLADMAVDLLIHGISGGANGIFNCHAVGSAMGDDRYAVQTDQRRAPVCSIIQPAT